MYSLTSPLTSLCITHTGNPCHASRLTHCAFTIMLLTPHRADFIWFICLKGIMAAFIFCTRRESFFLLIYLNRKSLVCREYNSTSRTCKSKWMMTVVPPTHSVHTAWHVGTLGQHSVGSAVNQRAVLVACFLPLLRHLLLYCPFLVLVCVLALLPKHFN